VCLSPAKSEATLLGRSQYLRSFPAVHSFSVASSILTPTDKATILGVILDSKLTFDAHVSAVWKKVHFHLRALRHIGSSLTDDILTFVAVGLRHSRLDYANSFLYGISSTNIQKLQRYQNTAARLVLQQSCTILLFNTSWTGFIGFTLPIRPRIYFKIASLTYKTLSSGQPAYFRKLSLRTNLIAYCDT